MSSNGETKNILIFSQNYFPSSGNDYKIKEFVENMLAKGYNISVITNKSPSNKEELNEKIDFYFVDQDNYNGGSEWSYVFHNISYLWDAMKMGFQFRDKIDTVIATVPTAFTAIVGKVVSASKDAKFYIEVKENWVENALALNYIKNGSPIYKAAIMVENWMNKNCEKLPDNF